ncbi:enoyl-CoA hydratase-related protein [Amycolatopsis sp. FU40]|uniref:enoyl-CoA hydratase-related protein n=1 Tax=Amycolatopsis sp. FU40 TaxID=2914159 RepID=UPI001F02C884|nr:enoyl-CoA hydratase-related protein [Amycolatopsis sp. FU40]UKD57009.1 enoyl-CoA hydratase-related protein [Amycolatopsis sp. FU40]
MLEYRNGTVVVRFLAEETGHLAAALAYAGPLPVVLTGTARQFAPDLGAGLRSAAAAVRKHPAPVVAAVNGDAIGAGYALAEAADLRIMSGGVVHPAGWPRPLDAAAAAAAGLVDLQCPPARLLSLAVRLAGRARPGAAA